MAQTTSELSDGKAVTTGNTLYMRPPELALWINTLPLADVGETYQRVMGAILQLNERDLSREERYEAMELFRDPLQYLSEGLKHHFIGASLPLTLRARGIADDLYQLQMEMAKGYQRIADESLALDTLHQDFTLLTTSLYRALYYLSQGLLTQYQIYEPNNGECWRIIHHCFEVAEQKGVQTSVIKDGHHHHSQAMTIEEQYKRILLLALANPFRYSQTDINWIYMLLDRWTPMCHFHPDDDLNEPQHACLVDLASDEGPSHITYSSVHRSMSCRTLDTGELVQTLQRSFPRASVQAPNQIPDPRLGPTTIHRKELLRSLITAWGPARKRRFSRSQPNTVDIEINLGLSAIHQLINDLAPQAPDSSTDDDERHMEADYESRGPKDAPNPSDDISYVCEVINESAEGLRLKWSNANKAKIRIGELVAIRQADDTAEPSGIAVIRWLKTTGMHAIEFGIQLLSPDAIPVTLRHFSGKDRVSDHDYLKGLFIPEFKATHQPASLILPAFLYHADDIVSLLMDNEEHYLRLTKAVETTQGYSRFHFASLNISQEQQH